MAVRADTVISAPHFSLKEREPSSEYTVQGTLEEGRPVVTAFIIRHGKSSRRFETGAKLPDEMGLRARFARLTERATALARDGGFFVESVDPATGTRVSVLGTIRSDQNLAAQPDQRHARLGDARLREPGRRPRGVFPEDSRLGCQSGFRASGTAGFLVAAWPAS